MAGSIEGCVHPIEEMVEEYKEGVDNVPGILPGVPWGPDDTIA